MRDATEGVVTAEGIPASDIRVGDRLMSLHPDGRIHFVEVRSVRPAVEIVDTDGALVFFQSHAMVRVQREAEE
mgnify:CR=1 FL=1